MHSWERILDDLPYDRKERVSVDRFVKNPESQSFLPVYEILKRKAYPQEAFELLVWGQRKFPNYHAARAILARELYERGLIYEASETIEAKLDALNENILAQKILFKSAILCGSISKADQVWHHLKSRNQEETEITQLTNIVKLDGLEKAQAVLLKEFAKRGINLPLPSFEIPEKETIETEYHSPARTKVELGDLSGLDDFQALPLNEIFRHIECHSPQDFKSAKDKQTIEDRTLAELYKKQGLFEQALECYKRILISSPNSDHAKRSKLALEERINGKNPRESLLPNVVTSNKFSDEQSNQRLYRTILNNLEDNERPKSE